jgi:peptidyl-dipeptidase Dcp
MGHALQGLLGTNVKHQSLQGTSAPADFIEFHSMVNERRALLRKNLEAHALHVETGKPPSHDIIGALTRSKSHFEARDVLKLVQNSLRDLEFHTIDPSAYKGDEALEQSVALDSPYADHIRPYPLARFSHLFDSAHGGYAAGYVNYLIAQIHAADGFAPFEGKPYDASWSKKLNDLYCRGSGGEPLELYRAYRGRDATVEAMLREAGITDAAA